MIYELYIKQYTLNKPIYVTKRRAYHSLATTATAAVNSQKKTIINLPLAKNRMERKNECVYSFSEIQLSS